MTGNELRELVKSKLYSVCHNEKNRKENSEVTK